MSNIIFTANGQMLNIEGLKNVQKPKLSYAESKTINIPDEISNIRYGPSTQAILSINSDNNDLDTLFLQSIKGPNTSHAHWGISGDWHISSAQDKGKVLIQNKSSTGSTIIGKGWPSNATLTVNGNDHKHGSLYLKSDKGPYTSHAHWGPTGDWYLCSADETGKVVIQDTAPNGETIIASNLTLKGGVSEYNPNSLNSYLPFSEDQGNYIRGNTEIRGTTTQIGPLYVATEVEDGDANSEQLVIGTTDKSHLRLGRNNDYSWIQSHGGKPLHINPFGSDICINGTCFSQDDIEKMKALVSPVPTGPVKKRNKYLKALIKVAKAADFVGGFVPGVGQALKGAKLAKAAVNTAIKIAAAAKKSKELAEKARAAVEKAKIAKEALEKAIRKKKELIEIEKAKVANDRAIALELAIKKKKELAEIEKSKSHK